MGRMLSTSWTYSSAVGWDRYIKHVIPTHGIERETLAHITVYGRLENHSVSKVTVDLVSVA